MYIINIYLMYVAYTPTHICDNVYHSILYSTLSYIAHYIKRFSAPAAYGPAPPCL